MSSLIEVLRAIIRDEIAARRPPELGIVTQVHPGDGDAGNHQADLRLRASGLELARVPVAVPRLGFSLLPRPGDLVVVLFVDGDVHAPVVVGSLYDAERHPPEAGALDASFVPPDDEDSAVKRFHIATPGGGVLTIDDAGLRFEAGGTKLEIAQDGDVTVTSAKAVSVEAESSITLKAGSDMTIEAATSLTLKGAQVTIEGQSEAKLKGASVTIAGMTSFSAA
ncbi:DUF2345 domain-containing protein [Neoroseomonas lacus]|uniref:Gp5/Type VI secretion system Vgr protein OB-fold domain-containing protein n=1 Tax=Neoroseomonas lacus TaxID=287609 RepID=A0A917NHV8_9PROT|nr:DUF2345 domain-containing protein [Neoroseomonas lacus]GGJ02345.1 hypothetical protein GCM10011320_06480 [Neoroseomonas lacus]